MNKKQELLNKDPVFMQIFSVIKHRVKEICEVMFCRTAT